MTQLDLLIQHKQQIKIWMDERRSVNYIAKKLNVCVTIARKYLKGYTGNKEYTNILVYNQNIKKCICCGNNIDYAHRHNKFCTASCAATYKNLGGVTTGHTLPTEYNKNPKNCPTCGKILEYKYKHKTYCSVKCSPLSNIIPLKNKPQNCVICGSIFYNIQSVKTCSKKCKSLLLSKSLKEKTGGPRVGGGWGKHSDYTAKNGTIFHCQSNMEYSMCKILDVLNIKWQRNLKGFAYITIDGKNRKYYPDYYLIDYDVYLETKGYITKDMLHKMNTSNIPKLIIIKNRKYGGDFEDIETQPTLLLNHLN